MLQPMQLEDVAARFPREIVELREFVVKAGFEPGMAESLRTVAARLRDDHGFRRDLKSHVWMLMDEAGQVSLADLQGIVALAVAGPRFAAAAEESEAHELLRFLMEARRSFGAVPARQAVRFAPVPVPARPYEPMHELPLLSRAEESEEWNDDQGHERRRAGIWAVATCGLAVLLLGYVVDRYNSMHHAVTAPPAAQVAADSGAAPIVMKSEDSEPGVANEAGRPATVRNSPRLPSAQPVVRRAAKPAAGTPLPAAGSPAAATEPAYARSKTAESVTKSAKAVRAKRAPLPPAPTHSVAASAAAKRGPGMVPPVVPVPGFGVEAGDSAGAVHTALVRPTSLGTMAANVIYSPAPAYPPAAEAAHVQGEVKVEAEVDREGNVVSTRVVSGPPLLRDAAADAIQQWRYKPYVSSEGKPTEVSALVVMDFELK